MSLGNAPIILVQQAAEQPLWLTQTQTWSEIVGSVVTTLGIVLAGLFAYYKFAKGRTFAPRVEPTISGTVRRHGGTVHLQVTTQAKNAGLSRVKIDTAPNRTGIAVLTRDAGERAWRPYDGQDVFGRQVALEPGQSVGEPLWFELPESDYVAIRLVLGVAVRRTSRPFVAQYIVNLIPESDNEVQEQTPLRLSYELKEGFKRWWSHSRAGP